MWRADVPMTLGRAGTPALAVSVWAVDEDRARLHLHLLSGNIPTATRLAEHGSLWAAGYLQGAKVQFNVRALAGESRAAPDRLSCAWPQMMFHLPRRRVVRVRRVAQQAPQLHFEHPLAPELRVSHRLLDISTEGCAFLLPPDALPLSPGLLLRAAELELDDQHFVFTTCACSIWRQPQRAHAALRVVVPGRACRQPARRPCSAGSARDIGGAIGSR
jgi:c-di-GMP-binding flagellar brake protein YcgR